MVLRLAFAVFIMVCFSLGVYFLWWRPLHFASSSRASGDGGSDDGNDESCPFDSDGHHHHGGEGGESEAPPQYIAELVDPVTGRVKYLSMAYKSRGVLLLNRFNFRSVLETRLIPPTGNSSATDVLRSSSSSLHPTVVFVLFYKSQCGFSADFYEKFVPVAEEVDILWNQIVTAHDEHVAGVSMGRPRASAAPSPADTLQLVFAQVNVDELKPPEHPEELRQEAEELEKTGGSVRDFLFSMPEARRLVVDCPSIAMFVPSSNGTGVSLVPFAGRWTLPDIIRAVGRSPSVGGRWGRRWLEGWELHVPAVSDDDHVVDAASTTAATEGPSATKKWVPEFVDGVLVV
jgi:hypothetical protein